MSPPASSAAVAQSVEKGYDDLDMPVLSPLGSLENLYEAILPKEGATGRFPYYDPLDKAAPRSLCPNVPAEGYLEPVAPAASSAAVAAEGACEQSEAMSMSSVGSSPARSLVGDAGAGGGGGGKADGVHKPASSSSAQAKVKVSLVGGEWGWEGGCEWGWGGGGRCLCVWVGVCVYACV